MDGEREPKDSKEPIDYRFLAINRLQVREYGAAEMRTYLKRKGANSAEAEKIVAELVEQKMIDDRRYARVIARAQAMRDKGPAYVSAKLMGKGVRLDRSEVKEIFKDVAPEDELATVRRIVERRYPRAFEDRDEKKRAYAGLLRRGFSRDVVSKCLFSGPLEPIEDDGF